MENISLADDNEIETCFIKEIDELRNIIRNERRTLSNYFLMGTYPYSIKKSKKSIPVIDKFRKLEKLKYKEFILNFKRFISHCDNAKNQLEGLDNNWSSELQNLSKYDNKIRAYDGNTNKTELTLEEIMTRLGSQNIRNAIERCNTFVNNIRIEETGYYNKEKDEIDNCKRSMKQFLKDHLVALPNPKDLQDARDRLLYNIWDEFTNPENTTAITSIYDFSRMQNNDQKINDINNFIRNLNNQKIINKEDGNCFVFYPRVYNEIYSLTDYNYSLENKKSNQKDTNYNLLPTIIEMVKKDDVENSNSFSCLKSQLFICHEQQRHLGWIPEVHYNCELIKWLTFPKIYKRLVEIVNNKKKIKQNHLERNGDRDKFYVGLAQTIKKKYPEIEGTTVGNFLKSFYECDNINSETKKIIIQSYCGLWGNTSVTPKTVNNNLMKIRENPQIFNLEF